MLAERGRTGDDRTSIMLAMRGLPSSQLLAFARHCFGLFEQGTIAESDIMIMLWSARAFGRDLVVDSDPGATELYEEMLQSTRISEQFRASLPPVAVSGEPCVW